MILNWRVEETLVVYNKDNRFFMSRNPLMFLKLGYFF